MAERIPYEEILSNPDNMRCMCLDESEGKPFCGYRGKCKECVSIHRFYHGLTHCLRDLADKYPPPPADRLTNEQILENPENVICRFEADSEFEGDPIYPYLGQCKECIAINRYNRTLPLCVKEHELKEA